MHDIINNYPGSNDGADILEWRLILWLSYLLSALYTTLLIASRFTAHSEGWSSRSFFHIFFSSSSSNLYFMLYKRAAPQPWDVCTLSSLLPSVVDSFSAFSVSLLISIQASTSLHMQQLIRFTPLFLHHLVVLVIGAHSFTALGWIVPFFLHPRSTL